MVSRSFCIMAGLLLTFPCNEEGSMYINKVFMAGNLTHDPDLRNTANGNQCTTMQMALNRVWNQDGERKEEAMFVRVVSWGKSAEFCGNHLKKGDAIFVSGRLSIRQYEKDGQQRWITEVVADNVQSINHRQPQPALA